MTNKVRSGLRRVAYCGLLLLAALANAADEEAPSQGRAAVRMASAGQPPRQVVEQSALLAGGLPVRLEKTMFREGEALRLTIEVPREGFLNIIGIRPGEEPVVLFPNGEQADNKVGAGKISLPGKAFKLDLRVTKPYGVITIAAFLSGETLAWSELTDASPGAEDKNPNVFQPLSAGGRLRLAKLAARSFASDETSALLLGGLAYGLFCAASGPCNLLTSIGEERGVPGAGKLTPGLFLDASQESSLPAGVRLPGLPDKGVRLTKASEGYAPLLDNDASNFCSIGYGHVVKKAPCSGSEPTALRWGLSELQADVVLNEDLRQAQRAVLSLVTVELGEAQLAALFDFTYNVGAGKFEKSTLLKVINAGEHEKVTGQMRRWIHVNGSEYPGLRLRREREIALYFAGKPIPKVPADEEITPIDLRVGE